MLIEATQTPWQQIVNAYSAKGFWWMTGFEGSNIPQIEADEYEWTQHYTNYAQDLAMAQERLGIQKLRYTLPWSRLNPEKGRFEWAWADRVVERASELGLDLVVNPVHFGTPAWLEQGFGHPAYPEYAAEYFSQLARRYGQRIKFYTPHNEPLISALFSADFGHWPPYWKGLKRYVQVAGLIARQIVLSVEAVRREVPEAVMVHVEAGEYYATREKAAWLQKDVQLRNERRFLIYDLVSGRVGPEHPLLDWLTRHGMSDRDLAWFREHAIELDVVGVDFYPHCEAWLELHQGEVFQHRDHGNKIVKAFEKYRDSARVKAEVGLPISLYGLLKEYYERYQRPIMVTETDYCGRHEDKVWYMRYGVAEIKRLREEGVPVLGYTWWPAIDHLNWDKALKERGSIHPVGLWELRPEPDGRLTRVETVAAEAFRQLVAEPEESVGTVANMAL